jgi:hypothetical protein
MMNAPNPVVTGANQVDAGGPAGLIFRGRRLDRALLCQDGGLPRS